VTYRFDAAMLAFRDEVRGFLAGHPELLAPRQFFSGRGGRTRELYRALGARGWLSLRWPVDLGGGGRSPAYDYLLWNELAYARAARPDLAAGVVAATLIEHGTAEQHARFLPGIRSGDTGFALGYSEPEAGSDLAGLRTRAIADGDTYVVRGEKRWTSDAHNSRYLWLLCRTGEPADRSRGLTLLILDLAAPGVTIHPIPTIDGHRLNHIFLDDVAVPAANRVGPEGGAWRLIREALAVERHLQLLPGRVQRDFDELWRRARSTGRLHREVVRDRVVDLAVDVAEVETQALETLAAMEAGIDATVPAARVKLLGTEVAQRIARTSMDLGWPESADEGDDLAFLWSQTVMETIAGGTSEIMRGLIARQALGLRGSA
jgi:alkylation response protein AidB-like acyl-CoA dehydrogenase